MNDPIRREKGIEKAGDILADVKDPELRRRLASLGRAMKERGDQEPEPEPEPEPQAPAKVIQLPLWPEPKRGVPNSVLRGALFAAIQGKHRAALKRELLETPQGIEIRFTGWQLDQSDLDVWEQALHLARQHPLGTRCHFTAHSFLKALGRRTGGTQHEQLKEEFARLGGGFVEITHGRITYGGSLLELIRDEEDGRYVIEINPKIAALYSAGWSSTDWEQRLALKGKPLALWLHGYYSTHAAPLPVSVEYMQRVSGSRNGKLKSFKQKLIKAHEELQTVGAIKDFEIKNGLVSVDNMPSDSQQRHLKRAKPRRK